MAIANIGIATNNRRKRGDEYVDEACFIDVKMFGRRAEAFAKYHQKGSPAMFPNAHLAYEEWTSRDGDKRNRLVVHANEWTFAESKKTVSEPPSTEPF